MTAGRNTSFAAHTAMLALRSSRRAVSVMKAFTSRSDRWHSLRVRCGSTLYCFQTQTSKSAANCGTSIARLPLIVRQMQSIVTAIAHSDTHQAHSSGS